ncbi:hypothetical protein BLNAU_17452 [Blattamonas nauphoetae]|uniref:SPRY domain-containing protein n=1 Tax=Blattamonas nauphoetae TaxID=2049346 RepID=A0ABQ9X9R4_9EUKA|nr:hypothetical protein BLNAU_17452 [Blattamonas nauphoetae]
MDFDESKLSTSIPSAIRSVLGRLLDPNPDCRATSTQLFKGRLLERMLGPETSLSKLKDGQIQCLENKLAKLTEENDSLQKTKQDYKVLLRSHRSFNFDHLPFLNIIPIKAFKIRKQTFTLSRPEHNHFGSVYGRVIIAEPITRGIVSVSITLHTLTTSEHGEPFCLFLSPTAGPFSLVGDILTFKFTIYWTSSKGHLEIDLTSTGEGRIDAPCHEPLREGDTVVVEVNMESNPRTVQFFVNGKAGKCYVAGIPESMHVIMVAEGVGTSFRLNGVTLLTTPTPFAPQMKCIPYSKANELTLNTAGLQPTSVSEVGGVPLASLSQKPPTSTGSASSSAPQETQAGVSHPSASLASGGSGSRVSNVQPAQGRVKAKEHPDYIPWLEKAKVKSVGFLKMQMRNIGLNPDALDDPEMLV